MRVDHRLDATHMRLIECKVDAEQWRSLQIDATAPSLACFREHWPRDRRLRPDAVDMCPDRTRSMRIGAAQGELHPRRHIWRAPVGGPVSGDGGKRGAKRSVGIGDARPDMAVVEMGVGIDEKRQSNGAAERQAGRLQSGKTGAGRDNRADAPFVDQQIDQRKILAVDPADLDANEGTRNFGARQRITRSAGDRIEPAHYFTPHALGRYRANGAAAGMRPRSAPDRSECRRAKSTEARRTCAEYGGKNRIRGSDRPGPPLARPSPPRSRRRSPRSARGRRRFASRLENKAARKARVARRAAGRAKRRRAGRDRADYGRPTPGRGQCWTESGKTPPETRRPAPQCWRSDRSTAMARSR